MQRMLLAADLGPEYWSSALRHAIYVKNRLQHAFIKNTPFEAITGTKPNITNLRTFGCRVFVRKLGIKPAKLHHHTSNGIFVGYTSTTKHIYYIDDKTLVVKNVVHTLFDEAHLTAPRDQTPIAAQALQSLGYSAFCDEFNNGKFKSKHKFRIKLIGKNAKPPERSNTTSIGYNIFTSNNDTVLQPGTSQEFNTDIIVNVPEGCYMDIVQPQAHNPLHWNIHPMIVDTSSKDQIRVVVNNPSTIPITIKKGQCIAQMLYKKSLLPTITTKKVYDVILENTAVPQQLHTPLTEQSPAQTEDTPEPVVYSNLVSIIPFKDYEIVYTGDTDDMHAQIKYMYAENELPYQITCLQTLSKIQ